MVKHLAPSPLISLTMAVFRCCKVADKDLAVVAVGGDGEACVRAYVCDCKGGGEVSVCGLCVHACLFYTILYGMFLYISIVYRCIYVPAYTHVCL